MEEKQKLKKSIEQDGCHCIIIRCNDRLGMGCPFWWLGY